MLSRAFSCKGLVVLACIVPFVAAASPLQLRDAQRLQQEGKLQEAIAVLEPLVKSEPDNLEGGSLLAWLYVQTRKSDLAIEEFQANICTELNQYFDG